MTAAIIQVLVLMLTLAAASGAAPMAAARLDACAMVDAASAVAAPSHRRSLAGSAVTTAPMAACPSVTAGRVVGWVDQGRGAMPPPMA